MGVCICLCDPIDFDEQYDSIIEELFSKYGLIKNKTVFSSSNISALFGKNRREYVEFLQEFIIKLNQIKGLTINIVYTTLSPELLADGIKIYEETRGTPKTVKVPEFLRMISQYYPYLSAWIITKRVSLYKRQILLDNLQGDITQAWREITSNQKVTIYPNGDLVCREISAADICIRFLDEMLYLRRKSLRREDIESIFNDINVDIVTHYLGHEDIDKIKPLEKKSILTDKLFVEPMVYILKEQIMDKELEYLKGRHELMEKIEEYTHSINGGLKFIDYTQDYKFLQEGDHVICLGPRGKEQADYLNRLGYKLNIKMIEEL